MAWELQKATEQKARKTYHCEASEWIDNSGLEERDFSAKEWAIIENARSENYEIRIGAIYLKIKGKWEGEFSIFRARIDLDKICEDHNLYCE
tara:strand:- start:448 stop:723 length:276 start_codon:yes stop_codon:yes gene_type:complete